MQLDGANNTGEGNFQDRDTWTDLSGNNKNGVINGATWNGNSLVFDGVNDWVNCDLSNTDYKTIEATFSVDSLSTLPQAVIGNAEAGGGDVYISTSGNIMGRYYINGGWRTIISPVKVVAGKAYHVAVTYDGTTVILYVNGVEQSKIYYSGTIGVPAKSTVMALGANPTGSRIECDYFNGKIYSARIYDRALTEDEVKKNCVSDQVLINGKMLKTAYVDNLEYTFTWDEEIDKFTSSEINVENGTKGTFTQVTKNKVYKLVVATPDGGIVKVSVPEGVCKDSLETASIASEIKTIEIDKLSPTYTSIEVKNVTTTGYDVYVYGVTDNYSGISRVQFPTWTESNGQDDIQADWQTSETAKGTMQEDGTTWVYRVNVTDHNNEYGNYNTHIYVYDNLGNCTNIEADNKVVTVPGVNITYLSGNLLYGLGDDVAETTSSNGRMKYSIENYAVTVTALQSDGYGLTPGRVYLEAGKTYRFSCDSTGTFGGSSSYQTEALFMLNGSFDYYRGMASNNGYEFTPNWTGTYWLRLDVNTSGETHTFSNIQVYEVTKKETKGYAAKLGTLPTLTREGYVFNGWFTEKTGGTKISSDTTVPESNITYYAQWTEKNYQNTTSYKYYETLKSALDSVATGQTIKVLNSRTERESPTLASGKTVTIDTNGQTTTLNGVGLINNGVLTINGAGTVTSLSIDTITNNGTLNVEENTTIGYNGTNNMAIQNSGTLNVNGGIINSEYRGIKNYEAGRVTISGGTIATKAGSLSNLGSANTESAPAIKITGDSNITSNGSNAISNEAIGLIHIDGGTINTQTGGAPTIINCADGKILITSGTINCSGTNATVYNGYNSGKSTGTVEIRGGTIETSTADGVNNQEIGNVIISGGTITSNKCAVINRSTGKVTISGGTIKSTAGDTIQNRVAGGTTEITSGTIISDTMAAAAVSAGTIKVTGGSLEGKTFGIWNNAGTVIVGDNSNAVNITSPSIIGKTAICVSAGSGTFNFYDGIIMGPSGKSIGTVSEVATGYTVVKGSKTIDNVTYETSVLGPSAPAITAKLTNASGATYTSGTWTNKNIYISLESANKGAGIKEYQWKEGSDGTWTVGNNMSNVNIGTITYTAERNSTIYFRAVDNNGVPSAESSIVMKIDTTLPTITVSPASATACKSKSVTITVADTGGSELSSSNSYQYYLSSSSTALANGTWTDYTSGTAFTIGTGITGTRYLFVRRVSDNAGNVSTANGTATTISGTTYQRFGSYVFDNTAPTVLINTESMYVTDGIVTRLDGVNNTNGSHSSSVTTWSDISGNGKNGTITSGTWGANYLQFNGTSSWVNLGQMNSNYQTLDATFSANALSTTASQMIIGNFEAGGGGIYINANGYIVGEYYINSAYRTITSPVKVEVGKVYHVSITYNGTTVILYVNGIEQGRISSSGTIGVAASSTVMALGTNPSGTSASGGYFNGKIYSAGVYNKALTAAQVKTNADAGKALAGGPTNASSITYTMRFSENVTGFTTDDITITNGTKGTFATVTSGRVFTVAVTTAASQNNTQTIALAANGCTDAAGNGLAATNKTVVIDRVAPTVTLSTNGGTYNIAPGSTTVSISTTLTAADTGSGVTGLGYAWATSNSSQPSTWTVFTSGTAISASRSGGNSYIWTNVIDNAGNRATSVLTSSAFVVRYQVVYNANGGSGAPGTQYKVHGTTLTLSSTKPTRTGYTFKEWNTKSDGTGTRYAAGASYTANSAVTLYAIWTINTYTITYNLNGGSVATANPTSYNITTNTITLNNPTRTGYTFAGWTGSNDLSSGLGGYTTSNPYVASVRDHVLGNSFDVTPGEKYRVFVTAKRTAGTLSLQGGIWYTSQTSGSSWDGVGGAFTKCEVLSDGWARYYKDITVPEGKTRGKFYIQLEQSSGSYTTSWNLADMSVIKQNETTTIPKGSYGNKTYTANWIANVYTITLNNQSATTAGSTAVYEKYATGIYKESGCTTAMTTSANAITKPSRAYTVTFNYNGNGTANTTATATWTFGGYYTSTGGNGTQRIGANGYITSNFANTSYTANGTLYAKWTGGTVSLPSPTRTGYTFAGWYTAASGGTQIKSDTQITSSQTVFAHWNINSYTITLKAGNGVSTLALDGWTNTGTATMTKSLTYGSTLDLSGVTVTNKTGYSGSSWVKTTGSGTLSGTSFKVGAGTTTLTVNATALATPTASIGSNTSKVYGASSTTLTGSTTTSYDSGVTVYYKFGNATSSGGTYTYGTASTTKTTTVSSTSHYGYKYYKVQIYATDGTLTSSTTTSSYVYVLLKAATITFNATTNGGTLSGTSPLYAKKGITYLYTSSTGTTKATVPTATKTDYRFDGWYTASSGGSKVLNADGSFTGTAVSGYTTTTAWNTTANKTLYARFTPYDAKIDNTYYLTLQDAVTAAGGVAHTINLLRDVNYTTTVTASQHSYFKLDLGGHTITSSADYAISLTNPIEPTIKNGSIVHTNTTGSNYKGCILIEKNDSAVSSCDVILQDINLTSNNGVGIKATGDIDLIEAIDITIESNRMCVNIGDSDVDSYGPWICFKSASGYNSSKPSLTSTSNYAIANYVGLVSIDSGEYNGGIMSNDIIEFGNKSASATNEFPKVIDNFRPFYDIQGKVYFNSGSVINTDSKYWAYETTLVQVRSGYIVDTNTKYGTNGVIAKLKASTSKASASIASTFSLRSSAVAMNQANQESTSEELSVKNGISTLNEETQSDGTSSGGEPPEEDSITMKVKIGDKEYEDLQTALDEAKNNEEIVLLQDINLKEKITAIETTKAKINLNGYKLQSETGEILENYGTIQIIDTSEGKIVGKITNYKDLEIKGGTIVDKEKLDEVDKTEFDTNDKKAILERNAITIYNKKGNLTLSGGNVENNSNEGVVIYNSKEGNVVLKTGKLIANGSKAIGIVNEEGKVSLNIDEELIKEANGKEVKQPEITLSGLNSIGIYNIGENAYLELQHGIIKAKSTIIGNITKILDGYMVREEEIEGMMQLTLVKEEG